MANQAQLAENALKVKHRQQQDDIAADPVLSVEQMCEDANISRKTWYRNWRYRLPIVQVSQRRIGCRRSAWLAALEAA
jgi:hypothetical protein